VDTLSTQVQRYALRHDLLPAGQALVVGVSGGPDSLCLLHLLWRMPAGLRLRMHVAHLNHGLRGAEADADAAFVAETAQAWGLPCTIGQADVARLAVERRLSLEEAARQARYGFLAEVAAAIQADTIAVAHNADDQAETVLMHFLRGSGVAGLRGMLPKTCLGEYRLAEPDSPVDLWLVRPLLATPRGAIEAYCAEQGLQPRFDRSNEDTTFFRNRLRLHLLPILESYNPAIRQVLAHTADVLAADHETLATALDEAWSQVICAEPLLGQAPMPGAAPRWMRRAPPRSSALVRVPFSGHEEEASEVSFDLATWRALPLGLQRATVRQAIHRLRRSLRNINWEHVERAVWLAREGETGQAATLAAGLELRIGYRTLRIADEGADWAVAAPQLSGPLPLSAPGITPLADGWQVEVSLVQRDALPLGFDANPDPWTAWLDADAVGSEPLLRPRAAGERFQPQGLGGHSVWLNEFMINAKTPRAARARWPLLVGRCGIAWVCGVRIDERAAVHEVTAAVWRVRFLAPGAGLPTFRKLATLPIAAPESTAIRSARDPRGTSPC